MSLMQRLCGLLSPDVPSNLQGSIYTPSLLALRNYLCGPGVACLQTIESGNPWHPAHGFTKQIVINEKLPHRLLALLRDNCRVTAGNCSFLRAAVLCLTSFAEDHLVCLEIVLGLGFRQVLVDLLTSMDSLARYRPLARSIFGALSVLVGHTHEFQSVEASKVPSGIALPETDLFHVLSACHRMLDVMANESHFDCVGVLNCALVLRYTMPLVTSRDPLYQVR